ncbi:hypothetical protein AYX14_02739 [Cryptococcus neoformans]|nr:hypothetical protein AYX14_02739 [Cryptococcus neoformans var. grubii]
MDAKRFASHSSIMTLVNVSDNPGPQSGSATASAKDDDNSSSIPPTSRPSDIADYSIAPFPTSRSEVQAPTQNAPLVRASTSGSYHAQNALRRMTTHETGEFVEDRDGGAEEDDGLHTHDEEHEHGHGQDDFNHQEHSEQSHRSLRSGERKEDNREQGKDEEAKIEGKKSGQKKKFELQDQTNLLPTKQVIFVFVGLTCALFCSLLDQTIVTTALPTLGQVFGRADISPWVGTAYLLTSTATQPVYGRLSDIFGRKFTLLGCLFIFLMGSLACALAQTMIQLIIFRAIQGLGGGGILTLAMIIISDVVSLKERGKYQGITGCVVALANSCGPIVGGAFTENASWRWCFYINLPLTSISMIIIVFLLPLRRVRGSIIAKIKKLDFYGSILTLAWAAPFLIALSWAGSQYPWDSAAVLVPLLVGLALLGLFIFVEAKMVSLPLVPMHIFKNVSVSACFFTTFMNGLSFYATLYYLPQYFQIVRGASAIRSGVLTLPLMLVQTVTSFTTGIIQSKTGDYWWNLVVGYTIWTIGLGLLSSITPTTSIAKLSGYQIIVGIGAGQTFQTGLVAIQASVERKDMATATGLRNFLRQMGGTIALAACNSIVNNCVRRNISGVLPGTAYQTILEDPTKATSLGLTASEVSAVTDAYSRGINEVFWFCAPCVGICIPITIFLVKKVTLNRSDDAVKKAEAKAWVESKKAKRAKKRKGSEETVVDSGASTIIAKEEKKRDGRIGKEQ